MLEIQTFFLGLATNVLFILFIFLLLFIILKKQNLIIITFIIFFISSLPITYRYPLYLLEKDYIFKPTNDSSAEAIVILGGGLSYKSHFQETDISRHTLERIRFAVFLQKKLSLPILVSGKEADIMKQVIESEFNGKVTFLENKSKTTAENAKFSFSILKKNNIKKVYLVTTSWHLKRAEYLFHKYAKGINLIPISGLYYSNKNFRVFATDFLPNMHTYYFQNIILHEQIALLWYKYININPSSNLY